MSTFPSAPPASPPAAASAAEERAAGAPAPPDAAALPSIVPSKPSSSRYDYIKVRVHAGPHYHVLSRYLLARRLSFTLLPSFLCVHLALLIKKRCVDEGKLDISREELEGMVEEGIVQAIPPLQQSALVIDRWRLVSRFSHRRLPLLILLTGTVGVAKSTLARKLVNRLNISTVLQTATVYRLCCSLDPSLPVVPVHLQRHVSAEAFSSAQLHRCSVVRSALHHDLLKCVHDGRPLLVEGTDIDFALYEQLGQGEDSRPIVLAFLIHAEPAERRMMMQGDCCRDEEAQLSFQEIDQGAARLHQWFEQRAEEQRTRWREAKDKGIVVGQTELPLLPQSVSLHLRCSSSGVASMQNVVLEAINTFCQ